MLSVSPETTVFSAETKFILPEPRTGPGRKKQPSAAGPRSRVDRPLIARLGEKQLKTVTFRDGPNGTYLKSRFMFVRVRAAHHWRAHDGRGRWGKTEEIPPREEWLIAEWPKGKPAADRLLDL